MIAKRQQNYTVGKRGSPSDLEVEAMMRVPYRFVTHESHEPIKSESDLESEKPMEVDSI